MRDRTATGASVPGTDASAAKAAPEPAYARRHHHENGLLAALDVTLSVIGQSLEAGDMEIDGETQEALLYSFDWYMQASGRRHECDALVRPASKP